MKIFIPSFKRARCVFALEVFPAAVVVVPVSQEAAYRAHNPGAQIVVIDDALDGNVGRKRNELMKLIAAEPDKTGFLVDDDCTRLFDKQEKRAVTPDEAQAVLQQLAIAAEQAGASLFGFSTSWRTAFKQDSEWNARDVIIGIVGVRNPPFTYDETVPGLEGTDFFLQHVERQVKTLRWDRYGVDAVRGNVGGTDRLRKGMQDASAAFAEKWGTRVAPLAPDGTLARLDLNCVKKLPVNPA